MESTLPRHCYNDLEFFLKEQKCIFQRQWFCVGRASELAQIGSYKTIDLGNENIIVTQNQQKQFRAYYNFCRHRGSRLVLEKQPQLGCFKGGIRCPYHSWFYSLDGDLLKTPHLEIDRSQFPLHQVAIAQWRGYLFIHLDRDHQDLNNQSALDSELENIRNRLKRYPLDRLEIGHRIHYSVAANWKVILENYNECYHCAGVHPELCKIVPAFRKNGGADLDWDRGVPHREGADTFTFSGTTKRQAFEGLNHDEQTRHKGELIYPNLMISLSKDHVASFILLPRSPTHTDIICDFLFDPAEISQVDFDGSDAIEFWDVTNRQDWDICESVQSGMGSARFEHGYYAPMEDFSLDIREYIKKHIPDSSS